MKRAWSQSHILTLARRLDFRVRAKGNRGTKVLISKPILRTYGQPTSRKNVSKAPVRDQIVSEEIECICAV